MLKPITFCHNQTLLLRAQFLKCINRLRTSHEIPNNPKNGTIHSPPMVIQRSCNMIPAWYAAYPFRSNVRPAFFFYRLTGLTPPPTARPLPSVDASAVSHAASRCVSALLRWRLPFSHSDRHCLANVDRYRGVASLSPRLTPSRCTGVFMQAHGFATEEFCGYTRPPDCLTLGI